jgi:hypothetical protein
MGVLQVVRINPQALAAVQMSMANSGQIAALLATVSPNGYDTMSQTGAAFAQQGGWRVTFKRADHPDQFAYPGDWILVTDATHTDNDGWTLAPTSEVFVYGVSTGLAGTADDFTNTFTAAT